MPSFPHRFSLFSHFPFLDYLEFLFEKSETDVLNTKVASSLLLIDHCVILEGELDSALCDKVDVVKLITLLLHVTTLYSLDFYKLRHNPFDEILVTGTQSEESN